MIDIFHWQAASYSTLISHLYSRYHDVHRFQLKELLYLADEVERENAEHSACPKGLVEQIELMMEDLESHMQREETYVFPMIKRCEYAAARGLLKIMEQEHEDAEGIVARMLEIPYQLQLPENASVTWQQLYKELGIFIDDLNQHIYLENEVLFPRMVADSGGELPTDYQLEEWWKIAKQAVEFAQKFAKIS